VERRRQAAGAVEILATLRAQLWARIAEHAGTWSHRPRAIVVYGSAARGDGNIDSDIDLLVVRPKDVDGDDPTWQQDLSDLSSHVVLWAGNPCEILDRSEEGLATMAANGERLLTGTTGTDVPWSARSRRSPSGSRSPDVGAQAQSRAHLRKAREFLDAALLEAERDLNTAPRRHRPSSIGVVRVKATARGAIPEGQAPGGERDKRMESQVRIWIRPKVVLGVPSQRQRWVVEPGEIA